MAMHFFVGAISAGGFASLYPQLHREENRRLYVIKGGPGCGKATCIRALCARWGEVEEYIHCCSDPDSLDGAVVADRLIVDGTEPHVQEPRFPGCDGEYIALPPLLDRGGLRNKREALYALSAASKACYAGAYRQLAAAKAVRQERRQAAQALLTGEGPEKRAAGLLAREVPKQAGAGSLHLRFLEGVTPKGYLCLHQTVSEGFSRIIALQDSYGLAQGLLEKLRDGALARGQQVYACVDPMEPDRLRHVLLPQCGVAFVTAEGRLPYGVSRTLHLDGMLPAKALRPLRGRLRMLKKLETSLVEDAAAQVAAAHALHDKIEELYRPHVDFAALERLCTDTACLG